MEIGDLLSKEELSAIKGGEWHYDEETDEWYWIEDRSEEHTSELQSP